MSTVLLDHQVFAEILHTLAAVYHLNEIGEPDDLHQSVYDRAKAAHLTALNDYRLVGVDPVVLLDAIGFIQDRAELTEAINRSVQQNIGSIVTGLVIGEL